MECTSLYKVSNTTQLHADGNLLSQFTSTISNDSQVTNPVLILNIQTKLVLCDDYNYTKIPKCGGDLIKSSISKMNQSLSTLVVLHQFTC